MTKAMPECSSAASPLRCTTGCYGTQSDDGPAAADGRAGGTEVPSVLVTGRRPLYSEVAPMVHDRAPVEGPQSVWTGNARSRDVPQM